MLGICMNSLNCIFGVDCLVFLVNFYLLLEDNYILFLFIVVCFDSLVDILKAFWDIMWIAEVSVG